MQHEFKRVIKSLEDAAEWDHLVESSPHSNPFVESRWLKIYSEIFPVEVKFYCLSEQNTIVAGLVITEKKKGLFIVSTGVPISLYYGLVSQEQLQQSIETFVEELFDAVEKRLHFYSAPFHSSLFPLCELERKNWKITKQSTIVLNIESLDTCWNNFSQSLRRKIRRATDDGLSTCETQNTSSLIEFHSKSYERQGMQPPIQKKNLKSWVDRLIENKCIRIFEVKDRNGSVCAARAIILYRDTVYDWLAGMNPDAKVDNASHLLLWNIIQIISKEGFSKFDFMGANTPGPSAFKKSFGGEFIHYPLVTYYRSKAVRSLESIHTFIQTRKRGLK